MELNQGQRNYLLELLNCEYIIPTEYYPSMASAIARYATANYTNEEIDFLLQTPQSPSATLMLNTTKSLPAFARSYALWLNCLEQNIYENNPLVESILLNPDPTSKAKLLQVIRHENENGYQYQIIPASNMIYTNRPRPQEEPLTPYDSNRRLKPTPLISTWTNETAQSLLADFLNFAGHSQFFQQSPTSRENQQNQMSDNSNGILPKQLSWQELRNRSRLLLTMNSTYVSPDQEQGLITPSNISFINYLNTQPLKKTPPRKVSRPAPKSAPPGRLFQQLKATLPNIKQSMKPFISSRRNNSRPLHYKKNHSNRRHQNTPYRPYTHNRQMPSTPAFIVAAHYDHNLGRIPQYPNHLNYHPMF